MDNQQTTENYYGLCHLKQEGAPLHPDDITYECSCDKCLEKRQKQLESYNNYYGIQS